QDAAGRVGVAGGLTDSNSAYRRRHGRACPACPGHLRLCRRRQRKSWMPGTRPGMTSDLRAVGIKLGGRCYISAMRIIGLAGFSGSGKTTLLAKAIPRIVERGLTVSTLKHAHHNSQTDQPGRAPHTHRMAGAPEVLTGAARRWALVHELRSEAEPALAALLTRLSPVDLVIIEGYKAEPHPKLEVHRAVTGAPLLAPEDPAIVAIASDVPLPDARVPAVDLDDINRIVHILLRHAS